MKSIIGIPARLGSTRFPGKPLKKILGMPMIQHVYKRCEMAENISDVFVATCDREIVKVVEEFGGKAYLTPDTIERPCLRIAEACRSLELSDDDIVVVVQGDEPLVHPDMINMSLDPLLRDKAVQCLTLVADAAEGEWLDPNEIKVVIDENEDILFMSRAPIPSNTRSRVGPRLRQIAIMPYRKKFLLDFQEMSRTPLEVAESIEMLRAVEHGIKIRTANSSKYPSIGVDTEADRSRVEAMMQNDSLFDLYKG
jgi:3-deoxy-manno-octulosonate cytidylyltransferase (CMP-KDO synthetase)